MIVIRERVREFDALSKNHDHEHGLLFSGITITSTNTIHRSPILTPFDF